MCLYEKQESLNLTIWITWCWITVCGLHCCSLLHCWRNLVCRLRGMLDHHMPLLLLLPKGALWLFSSRLCPLSHSPHLLHHFCNVIYLSLSLHLLSHIVKVKLVSNVTFSSIGCIILYTGQGKFHSSTINTLEYVVYQADTTSESLKNVSGYLAAAKQINVDQVSLPPNVIGDIDSIQTKINSSASTLSTKTEDNSQKIKDLIQSV